MELVVEVEGQPELTLPGGGAELVAFMSFCVVRGFGAQHPLIALADRLEGGLGVRLGPLTTFYGADPEDAEDREKAELAWQPAGLLAEALEGMLDALASDGIAQALAAKGDVVGLVDEASALLAVVSAAGPERRVRLLYRD